MSGALLSDAQPPGRSVTFLRDDVVSRACDAVIAAVRHRLDLATAHVSRAEIIWPDEHERRDNMLTGGRIGRNTQRLADLRAAGRLLVTGRRACGTCRLWTQPDCPRDRCGALAQPCQIFAPWSSQAAISAAAEMERRDFSAFLDAAYPSLTAARRASFWQAHEERIALKEVIEAAADDLDDTRVIVARILAIFPRGARGWHPPKGATAADLIAAATAIGQLGLAALAGIAAPFAQLIEDVKIAELAVTRAEAVAAGFAVGVVWEPPRRSGGGGGGGDGSPGDPNDRPG